MYRRPLDGSKPDKNTKQNSNVDKKLRQGARPKTNQHDTAFGSFAKQNTFPQSHGPLQESCVKKDKNGVAEISKLTESADISIISEDLEKNHEWSRQDASPKTDKNVIAIGKSAKPIKSPQELADISINRKDLVKNLESYFAMVKDGSTLSDSGINTHYKIFAKIDGGIIQNDTEFVTVDISKEEWDSMERIGKQAIRSSQDASPKTNENGIAIGKSAKPNKSPQELADISINSENQGKNLQIGRNIDWKRFAYVGCGINQYAVREYREYVTVGINKAELDNMDHLTDLQRILQQRIVDQAISYSRRTGHEGLILIYQGDNNNIGKHTFKDKLEVNPNVPNFFEKPHIKLQKSKQCNEITTQMFQRAVKQAGLEVMFIRGEESNGTLRYVVLFPDDCRLFLLIPTTNDSFINRKERIYLETYPRVNVSNDARRRLNR